MKSKIILLGVLFAVLLAKVTAEEKIKYHYPTEPEVVKTLTEWQDWKFGMFIHWGTYSQWGIVESWSICPETYDWILRSRPDSISYFKYLQKYEALKNTFNPVKFNPSKWAEAAKYAGMKYVVFTTKHHDGFNMFDTKFSDYKISDKNCPYHTNPNANIAKSLFEAFRQSGLRTGAYYSISDWHSNDFWWDRFPPKDRGINYPADMFPKKLQAFNDFVNNQLDELTGGNYGKLDMLWFDLCSVGAPLQWDRFAKTIRGNQPGAMMVARHTGNNYENYITPENKIPDETFDHPWEACITMAGSWSYVPKDQYRTTRKLLDILVQIVSRGGNLLLNVGPGPDGELHAEAYQRMHEIGDWMNINSDGIYGTKPVAPYREAKLKFTKKGNVVYSFYVSDEKEAELPAKVFINSFKPKAGSKVFLMGYDKPLQWTYNGTGVYIDVPESVCKTPPCDYIWCFKMQVK
ncbi:MAG: alpha-L-fucosidase [Bacteroidales bacterium]|nr:alpha-L-fucosidase [Bacteroidales bacterium]